MDRRREPRFTATQPATVRLLGENPATHTATVCNISGRGMRLKLDVAIPIDTALRVDVNGSMMLGEVCYTEPEDGGYAIGIVLDQVLHETPELLQLHGALQWENRSGPARRSSKNAADVSGG